MMRLQLKRLGIGWGAAYEEAQPTKLTLGQVEVTAFVSESYDLVLELPPCATIEWDKRGLRVVLPSQ